MDVVTSTFGHVGRYFSADLSLDSLVLCKFHTTYSMKHFLLYTLAYSVLGIGVKHEPTMQ